MTSQNWMEKSEIESLIRRYGDKHGPSGPAWNISAILDLLK